MITKMKRKDNMNKEKRTPYKFNKEKLRKEYYHCNVKIIEENKE